MFDLSIQRDLQFTLWVAIFAVPFQNLGIFGTDQLMAQRMFCCRNSHEASKAIVFSSVGQIVTLTMLFVGAALFVYYHNNPFTDSELTTVFDVSAGEVASVRENAVFAENPVTHETSNVIVPGEHDYVFPMWIVSVLPVGLSGLILAGVFAAAISSLDSILAALSQTTLSLIYHPERGNLKIGERELLQRSRLLVVIWGLVLTGFTFLLNFIRKDIPILPLAFGMTSYTVGPMLAIFLSAMWGKGSVRGLLIGTLGSFVLVLFVRTDIWVLVMKAGLISPGTLASLWTYELAGEGIRSTISFVWMWPLTTIFTFACGMIPAGGKKQG